MAIRAQKFFHIFYFYWYSVTNKHDAKQTIEESPPARRQNFDSYAAPAARLPQELILLRGP